MFLGFLFYDVTERGVSVRASRGLIRHGVFWFSMGNFLNKVYPTICCDLSRRVLQAVMEALKRLRFV